ncbi:hypothetical protein WN944_008239 [Citrus x changshan-huyou]|uniref:Uncharacterized protein n=1 Tax=Citrus x changshan-huyou TaxID=2935761 RepID=A0AAP0MQ67_9ROSI
MVEGWRSLSWRIAFRMNNQRIPIRQQQRGLERLMLRLLCNTSNVFAVFRTLKKNDIQNPFNSKGVRSGIYEPFSETQTESQVVSYEEDLSGRQKIIDRAKSEAACLEKLVQLRERS